MQVAGRFQGITPMVFILLAVSTVTARYGGGSGWDDDPYLIYTASQLNEIGSNSYHWHNHFRLMADIDLSSLSGTAFKRIGDRSTRAFDGFFDGNGHTISNFTCEAPEQDYIGLFYIGYRGRVKNLGLVNVRIKGRSYVGGLASHSNGTISNCFVAGHVAGRSHVGVLVGDSCWFGIVNCYAIGSASGDAAVGGLVGASTDDITNCYAAVAVSGREHIGGLVGRYQEGMIEGCYWDVDVSGQKNSPGGGLGRSTRQLMTGKTFLGWNKANETLWTLDEGRDYPRLAWEHKSGAAIPVYTLADFMEGCGSQADPYLVKTPEQLWTIGLLPDEWDKHFKLMTDLDLSNSGEKQWNIIGSRSKGFVGVFDGNGHTISHLTHDSDTQVYAGLFGYVGYWWALEYGGGWGEVKNLGVIDVNICGGHYVGALAGYNGGRIHNCFATGSVTGTNYVGGMVGGNGHVVADAYSAVHTSATKYVGGLVGQNGATIVNSYSTGPVSGNECTGGLAGDGKAAVNSFWDIDTSGQAASVGGRGRTSEQMKQAETYVGWNPHHDVIWALDEGRDYPRLAWEGRAGAPIAPMELGDLVSGSGTQEDPYRIATAEQFNAIGLFASEWNKHFRLTRDVNLSEVPACDLNVIGVSDANSFSGVFDGNDRTLRGFRCDRRHVRYVGVFGCVGKLGRVANLNLMDVNVAGGLCVGGLAGYLKGSVSGCLVEGAVAGNTDVGGLIGTNHGDVSDCHADVVAEGNMVGGLVGANCKGKVSGSGAEGEVRGTGAVGGLVGLNVDRGRITECYAHASVASTYHGPGVTGPYARTAGIGLGPVATVSVKGLATLVGGLVGYNDAEISNCYATGSVWGTEAIGGIVGCNSGSIFQCYAIGPVSGSVVSGGLVGAGYASNVSNSFWDIQMTGQAVSVGGEGRSTECMRQARTYWGWNDGDRVIWSIEEGNATPHLIWEGGPGEGLPGLDDLLAGSGTADDPFQIATVADLVAMVSFADQWNRHFRIMADLDLSACTRFSSHRAGISEAKPFKGRLDGRGHTLCGLVMDANATDHVGLFGVLAREAVVEDLHLVDCHIVGKSSTGILAGLNRGSIRRCSASGTVSGKEKIGVLVGCNEGDLADCCASGNAAGEKNVGGLIGMISGGTVSACYAFARVSGETLVGGLAGVNAWWSRISDSYAQGSVSGTSQVGGLVGQNWGVVTACYATGACSGTADVGGLAGANSGAILVCFWDIDTSGQAQGWNGKGCTTLQMKQARTYVGWNSDGRLNWTLREEVDYPRLAWEDRAGERMASVELRDILSGEGMEQNPYVVITGDQFITIGLFPSQWNGHFMLAADVDLAGYAAADLNRIGINAQIPFNGVFDGGGHRITGLRISSADRDYVGLFGYVGPDGHIRNLELVDVNVVGGSYVGSLAASNLGQLEGCAASGRVSGNRYVGGLAGYNEGAVIGCGTAATVIGREAVGGVVGRNSRGRITMSFAEGTVLSAAQTSGGNSWAGDDFGGLVGYNEYGALCYCFATGAVRAGTSGSIGGLVGRNYGMVSRCYARGLVEGGSYAGGLLGTSSGSGSVNECYSSGFVWGKYSTGGLVGAGDPQDVSSSFWDVQTSGRAQSGGGLASDTKRMQNSGTYRAAGWDFAFADDGPSDIWAIPEGGGYPVLWWELDSPPALPVFAGGTGTYGDPYVINDANTLNHIACNPRLMDKAFQLAADIDLQGTEVRLIGDPADPFTGAFDGDGHMIRNLTCDRSDVDHIALFRGIGSHGMIRNLGLVDIYLVGGNHVGGLAADNRGTISGCCVTGSVQGSSYVGGLVAYNFGAVVESYARASVKGDHSVGGLAGCNSARVAHCYAAGPVSGKTEAGGLLGGSPWTDTSDVLFWDMQVSGQDRSNRGTGKTTAQMGDIQMFQRAGWDFIGEQDGLNDIWGMPQGGGYPLLWWEVEPVAAPVLLAGGNGTPDDPYLISEPAHLVCIWANPRLIGKSFKLVQAIDMTGISFHPMGDRDMPFDGIFDGSGLPIVGLMLDAAGTDYVGFFACIGRGGQVLDLDLENVTVIGRNCVGALAGRNDGTVLGCQASGTVTGQQTVGGLIGWNRLGLLSGSSATTIVSSQDGAPGQIVGSMSRTQGESGRARR